MTASRGVYTRKPLHAFHRDGACIGGKLAAGPTPTPIRTIRGMTLHRFWWLLNQELVKSPLVHFATHGEAQAVWRGGLDVFHAAKLLIERRDARRTFLLPAVRYDGDGPPQHPCVLLPAPRRTSAEFTTREAA